MTWIITFQGAAQEQVIFTIVSWSEFLRYMSTQLKMKTFRTYVRNPTTLYSALYKRPFEIQEGGILIVEMHIVHCYFYSLLRDIHVGFINKAGLPLFRLFPKDNSQT